MTDALERIENQVKTYIPGNELADRFSDDLRSLCRELRAAREAVSYRPDTLFAPGYVRGYESAKSEVAEKMKEARG